MGLVGGGAQAEYVVSHEGLLVEIPQNLDFVQAAGIPEGQRSHEWHSDGDCPDDDEDDANKTVAAVTIAVARPPETATDATKQEDDEDYDEDGSERHEYLSMASANALNLLAVQPASAAGTADHDIVQ
jgi:hypothetical protein